MNEGVNGRQVHFGKSNWLYIILGPKDELKYEEVMNGLAKIEGLKDDIFLTTVPIPLIAPTSQILASAWSQQFWQTVYRKNNPLGPHPSLYSRAEESVSRDAAVWMTLAHQVAKKSKKAGFGEPIGAVIIKRTHPTKPNVEKPVAKDADGEDDYTSDGSKPSSNGKPKAANGSKATTSRSETPSQPTDSQSVDTQNVDDSPEIEEKESVQIVAIAADARWHQQDKVGLTGNPMAHAALRAISMVGQKLVRAEDRPKTQVPIMEFEAFQDKPLLSDEKIVFDANHPCPDGYLCHDLELYLTHEPCVMCAMAILHSRMGKIVFRQRMPLTGGLGSEDRGYDACAESGTCEHGGCGGGLGLGLHYRKELNWTLLGWEWETDMLEELPLNAHLHA